MQAPHTKPLINTLLLPAIFFMLMYYTYRCRCQIVFALVPPFCRLPENVTIEPLESYCYFIYKLRYRTLHMYFRLMAAIFDLQVTPTSESIYNCSTVLADPENVGVAVGMSLLCHIQAEI
jgi:hypothetical protein